MRTKEYITLLINFKVFIDERKIFVDLFSIIWATGDTT